MRKNAKKILVGAVLILTLAIFTACGSRNNNADEVEKENNKTTEENMAENESVDKKDSDEKPSDDRGRGEDGEEHKKEDSNNDGTVSGELGNSVKDLGEGVGNAVEDVGDAVGNATEGR